MGQAVDETTLRKLIAEHVPQREMARRLHIPRTSLQRMIKALGPAPPATASAAGVAAGVPVVDTDKLTAAEVDAVRTDFWELIAWWRQRRAQRVYASTPRETMRQTFHVEKPFIRLIHREAEAEGVSITEVVNRAFRAYFERR
jgi:hypothetical protein